MTDPDAETEVREALADWTEALCSLDIERLLAHYADDATVFDVKPPFQIRGAAEIRRLWKEGLACFPPSFRMEKRDLVVHTGGDLAVAHWLFRFAGMPEGHGAMKTWLRATMTFARRGGRWLNVHDHVSIPFIPESGAAAVTPEL